MTYRLLYYPGATPENIPAPNIAPTLDMVINAPSVKRSGRELTLAAGQAWSDPPHDCNVLCVSDGVHSFYYFIETMETLGAAGEIRFTASYSATMTALYNGFKCNAVCTKYSEPDNSSYPSITREPLVDDLPAHYKDYPAYTTLSVDTAASVAVLVTMATMANGEQFDVEYSTETPLTARQNPPYTFVLRDDYVLGEQTTGPSYANALKELLYLIKRAGTNKNAIQRIQIVPKSWVAYNSEYIELSGPVGGETVYLGVKGRLVTPAYSKRIYAPTTPTSDYTKAVYYNSEYVLCSWGATIATIPQSMWPVFSVGYSLSNGVNMFVEVTGRGPKQQIPITIPDILVVGDYFTPWYEANKDQILAQTLTAGGALLGSVALGVAGVASGGSLLPAAVALGGSALSAVNSYVSIKQSMEEAKRQTNNTGTSPTSAYTNYRGSELLEIHQPTTPTLARRRAFARFGYASNRIIEKIPTVTEAPRPLWCSITATPQGAEFPANGVIGRSDHISALTEELGASVNVWYGGTVGDFSQTNK